MSGDATAARPVRVSLADCPPQAWRNGGGLTRELLAWAPGGGGADWLLRVSVADITRDGPFSAFAGVTRGFAVLEGAGVVLGLPGGEQALTPADAPLHFAGEDAPDCRLIDGATRDLNFMVRRGAGQAHLRRAEVGERLTRPSRWRALYAADAARLQIEGPTAALSLPAGTLCWAAGAQASTGASAAALPAWRLEQGTRAFWLTLEAP